MKRSLLPILLIAALLAAPGAAQFGPPALAANGQSLLQAAPPTQQRFTITDLGTLGGTTTKGYGINEEGQVVGASQIGSYMVAFLWDDGTMANLGALGAYGSWAYDINDAGQVVGGSVVDAQFHNHAFRWQNGVMQDLGTMGGPDSYAFDINNSGQAVGSACCVPDQYVTHAVLWGCQIAVVGDHLFAPHRVPFWRAAGRHWPPLPDPNRVAFVKMMGVGMLSWLSAIGTS
jgi:probable HAF family extracellular repeat protein